MNYLYRGLIKTTEELDLATAFAGLEKTIANDLGSTTLDLRTTISALDALGEVLITDAEFLVEELKSLGLTDQEAEENKVGARMVLNKRGLYKKVRRELFETPLSLSRRESKDLQLEGYMSLGVLGHVTSSNDAVLPFLSSVEGLLTGNINLIKTARNGSAVTIALAAKLCEICPELAPYMYVFPVSSKEQELLKIMFDCCDGIAVWGSEGAVAGVRELAASGIRIIDWGHRISFSYITEKGCNVEALTGLAIDIVSNEQQACSAPQVVYYEVATEDEKKEAVVAFAKQLYDVLAEVSPQYPLHDMSDAERAEITTQTQLSHMKEIMKDGACMDGGDFRIYVEYDQELSSSPLFRTIIVKPITRDQVIYALRPFRSYLQTVGLSCGVEEIVDLTHHLIKAGVTRITSPGKMLEGYEGEPHDGVYALSRYVKRVSVTNAVIPTTISNFEELNPAPKAPFKAGTPVMKKSEFAADDLVTNDSKLIIKSGGSSGKAVYAPHTYADAEMTYQTSAYAMIAAGMDPHTDICMNLFYCGDMYGGFISMYEALKLADITQLPMAACMDLDFVMKEIVANEANVLIGMPSYLIRLFTEQKEGLLTYGKIKKIYYGGEKFNPAQIEEIKAVFGVEIIASLVYGCNEIGTIGYTCPYCTGSEHHLQSTKYMEILKMDSDEPVEGDEIGRIVLTPVDQENTSVKRYEIGDLGRYVLEPCECGRLSPKFELMGRFGDIFKFATNYVNGAKIKEIFGNQLGYTGWLQLELSYEDAVEKMIIKVQEELENAVDVLQNSYAEIKECLTDKTATVVCECCGNEDFVLSSGGGKVCLVVDQRVK